MRVGLLASSRCAGNMIVQGLNMAVALQTAPVSIASGFHSSLERESLKFLLRGEVHLVVCPARSAVGMRIPTAWKSAIATNRLAIRSAIDEGFEAPQHAAESSMAPRRPTAALAEQRNRFVAEISDAVLFLHASPRGKLEGLATDLLTEGRKPVWTLDDPANAHLIARGARPMNPSKVELLWDQASL